MLEGSRVWLKPLTWCRLADVVALPLAKVNNEAGTAVLTKKSEGEAGTDMCHIVTRHLYFQKELHTS
jgi:hypothetical protein